jgi:Ca2+-binding EF-hand superfamily protein
MTGFTEENILDIFKYYDKKNTGQIDYKEFVGLLFNNQSIMNQDRATEEALNQKISIEEQNKKEEEENKKNIENNEYYLFDLIKSKFQERGINGIISLEKAFRNADIDNNQLINFETFSNILNTNFKYNLTKGETGALFREFDQDQSGKINYDEFIRVVRGEIPENRKKIVQDIFENKLDVNKTNQVNIDDLKDFYNAAKHPDVLSGKKKEEEALEEFIETFDANHLYLNGEDEEQGIVDLNEFLDYYESVSSVIKNDEDFEKLVLNVWSNIPEVKDEMKDNKNEEEKEDQNNPVVKFKNKLKTYKLKNLLELYKQLKTKDEDNDKQLNLEEFKSALVDSDLKVHESEVNVLFDLFDFDKIGKINYIDFLDEILDDLNNRRLNLVLVAFNRVDLDQSGVVKYNEFKSYFFARNNPLLEVLKMTEEQLYSDFVQTFELHHSIKTGLRNKNCRLDEFINYYKFISFLIGKNDDLFEDVIKSSWKISVVPNLLKDSNLDNQKKEKRNFNIQPEKENQNQQQEQIKENNNYNVNPEESKEKEETKEKEESKEKEKEEQNEDKKVEEEKKEEPILKKKEPDVPYQFRKGMKRPYQKTTPYGIDNNPVDYSTSNQPEQIKATKKTNNPFLDFKNIIIDRGNRGILSLKRSFMITDDEGNHSLTFNNFEKYIKDYRLPLNDEEIKKIFDKFDTKKTGVINYDDLINELVGKINDYRTDILMKVFEKFDPEHTGNANLNEIRKNYNPNLHPEVLKGNKSSQEQLSEFLDDIDYIFNLLNQNKANDDIITIEEFLDFYKNFSFAIEDDEYFNSILSGVWGLNQGKNFGKKQLNKKIESLFDN